MRFFVLITVLLASTTAYAQDDEERYAEYYGDGIRAYTESRYEDALTNLYRALAVKQTPLALKLIVRVHDFQGNCTARERAAEMLRDAYPQTAIPPMQQCEVTGVLHVQCAPDDGTVRVNGAFDVTCGAPVRVPIGTHELSNQSLGAAIHVDVVRDQTTVANLTMRPHKWGLDERHKQVVELPRQWLRPGLLSDPDMPRTFKWKRPANLR